jgi:hypothetical protein
MMLKTKEQKIQADTNYFLLLMCNAETVVIHRLIDFVFLRSAIMKNNDY